ncbi:hypothetical protein MLD38_007230 [Melastoma candidum]|uniref:Uncharacterized protein n=1 Tax=Melastoma candidum TaxID=119954 RepID=A0ACB9RRP2_9MYRT|nr:hypothetical protein MLD38_007230 [Melastoma candidum]
MGTQFEYAINLVAASWSGDAFPFCGLDERGYPRDRNQEEGVGRIGSARTRGSMGEPANENSLESVRRKMQMQEDIFRKQVRELHRLYGVQKKLMGELKKEMEQSRLLTSMKSRHADFLSWPHQMASGRMLHRQRSNDEQGSQERSASSSGEATRMPRGLDLEIRPNRGENTVVDGELPCTSFVPPIRRDALHVDDRLDEETDVELTLTIGGRSSKRKSNNCPHGHREQDIESFKKKHSSASTASDHGDASNSNTSNIGGSSSMTSDQEKRRPNWLFPAQ